MLIKFCKNKKVGKMLAIMLVITMTFANIAFLGKSLISYAADESLENQGINTQHSNVRFDAYFSGNGGNNVHSIVFDATNNIQKINLYLSVRKAGYLKEAYIDFRDEAYGLNTNYEIFGDTVDSKLVQSISENMKTVSLNHVNSGTEAVLEIPIKLNFTELMEINKLNKNSLVTLRGIYVDEKGEETQISKSIKLNMAWDLETELNIEQSVTKYVPYEFDGQTGLILQVLVKAKQNREDIAMPVKSTELKISVPKIAENLPEKVIVSANNTMATNGNKVEFTNNNWDYNEEDETITIKTPGFAQNSSVWSGVGVDEYFVTYIYSSEVYEAILNNELALHSTVEGKMELYSKDGTTVKTASSDSDVVLSEKIGDIVTYNIEANQKELSKGRMYANCNAEEKLLDTEYTTTIKANISNYEMVNEISMNLPTDNFADAENEYTTKLEGIPYANYKQLVINKSKLQQILGEDGYINITDEASNVYTINNQTQDVDGNYVINFEEKVGDLKLQTSKPISDGILEISATKVISKDMIYTKSQLQLINQIVVRVNDATDRIALTETSTNAKLEISNTSLSTMVENKNVEMKILLNNNVETSDLYKNATFTINLPKYIEDVDITGYNILYTSGLSLARIEKIPTENGIVLKIFTAGAENDFSTGVLTNGTNIVLNTNIKVNTLTPNISDKVTFEYTNENATSYANGAREEIAMNFVAPEEMVTFNSVLTSGVESTSIDGNEQTAKLEILDSSKIATMKISILNKYSNVCNNIRILGRIPFVGNKSISTGEDLGTTFNAKLVSAINTNGVNAIVYYSSNESATEDLENIENAWTTDLNAVADVKSYLIVLPDYEMKPTEMLEFTYNCQIPEGLEHNESAYGTYAVYFDSVKEYVAKTLTEATKVGLTTGVGANLETSTKVIYQGNEITDENSVREYQYITYKTIVKNTGTVDATKLKLTVDLKNATVEDADGATVEGTKLVYDIESLPAGREETVEYTVKVGTISSINIEGLIIADTTDDDGNEIKKYYITDADGNEIEINLEDYYKVFNNVSITAENFEGTLEDKKETSIKEAEIKVTGDYIINGTSFSSGVKLNYQINVANLSDKELQNVVITDKLPEGLKYVEASSQNENEITYDEASRTITIKINSISAENVKGQLVYLETELPQNVGKIEVKNSINVTANGIQIYEAKAREIEVYGPVLSISLQSDITNGSYIKEGNKVNFTITVENTGEKDASMTKVKINLPKELKVSEAYYMNEEKQIKMNSGKDNSYYALTNIEKGQTKTFKIVATAKMYDDISEKTVSVGSSVAGIESNKLTYIIEKSNDTPVDPDNPSRPVTPTEETYKISGIAWLDKNENGIKDSDEELLEGIDVLLINADTGVIVTDKTNGTLKQTKTSSKGVYTFTNLPKGKYIVVFEYNSAYYDITNYKVAGATDDVTSKAIESKINKDGKTSVAGLTDAIVISNSSKANINIGLIVKPKFDLSLDKSISKITVENSKGTKSYDFENIKLAKVEIPGNYLSGSKVYVEYKIKVKNEGEIAGFARKIVDYMSPDFTFDVSANTNWNKGADGNLYNESLAEILINPGEEKEITLTLVKTMTEDNTGIVANYAEIAESYNEQNIEDYDSKVGNMAQDEDDFSNADVIISVKTGQVALYITITLISITIIAVGVYFINKKVLKGGK